MHMRARLTLLLALTAALVAGGARSVYAQPELPDTPPSETAAGVTLPLPPAFAPAPSAWEARPLKFTLGAAFVGLQAIDTVTTLHAVHHLGAQEANPMMSTFVDHPAAFVAMKSLSTIMVLGAVQRLSKSHPKTAALLMVAINAGYVAVAASNYRQIAKAGR